MLGVIMSTTRDILSEDSIDLPGLRIKESKQKLVSNQFIRLWNAHAQRLGKAPINKRTYMLLTGILSRRQQKMLREQFDDREEINIPWPTPPS